MRARGKPPDDWTTLLMAAAEPDAQRRFSVADDVDPATG
jgi:hypothetical protein